MTHVPDGKPHGKRGFAVISKYHSNGISIPQRNTRHSAGFDISAAETLTIEPNSKAAVPTGIKAYMQPNEWLMLTIRSSLAFKYDIMLINSPAVIDSDYYDNPDNEGHIMIGLRNLGSIPYEIHKGDRIAQGIFMPYLDTDGQAPSKKRRSGIGSTGK